MNLLELQRETERIARDFGLDFPEVIFEVVDWRRMNQVLAYNGFPVRYPHWTFGMAYNRHKRSFDWNAFRVYELVLNTEPCIAYLLASNELVAQKTVMLHVYGHAHVFKNNLWFAHTNRDMLNEMANHATRVRRHIDRQGLEKVEIFLDQLFSLDNLLDVHSVAICRRPRKDVDEVVDDGRLPADSYMEGFINPREALARQRAGVLKDKEYKPRRLPEQPEQDVLLFLLEHAPLAPWQVDLLEIVRDENYYFLPQAQTKIVNEGFATYCHSRLMTEKACTPDELLDYAQMHSGVVAGRRGSLNPYRLGYLLLLDIERRWDRGMYGREWEQCKDWQERQTWDRQTGQGLQKVFEVARVYNDIGFLDEFLTYEFAQEQRLFTYDYDPVSGLYKISGREFDAIKHRLLESLTNLGTPIIRVMDGNYENRGELYLKHFYSGAPLDLKFAQGTLKALNGIWQRPVHIWTVMHILKYDGSIKSREAVLLSYDKGKYTQKTLGTYEGE